MSIIYNHNFVDLALIVALVSTAVSTVTKRNGNCYFQFVQRTGTAEGIYYVETI